MRFDVTAREVDERAGACARACGLKLHMYVVAVRRS